MIVHSNGVASLYAHIRDGGFIGTFPRTVGQGEAIALAGNTGLTGAAPPVHLHFALRQGITADPPGLFDGSALRPEPLSGIVGLQRYGVSYRDGCQMNVSSPKLTSSAPPNPGNTRLQAEVGVCDVTIACPEVPRDSRYRYSANTPPNVLAQVLNSSGQIVASTRVTISYNPVSGIFSGVGDLGPTFPSGTYTVKLKFDNTTRGTAPGFYSIAAGDNIVLQSVQVRPGDAINDNQLSILDYNRILDCYSDLAPAPACSDPAKKVTADINWDGDVNQYDYNVFVRTLRNFAGD